MEKVEELKKEISFIEKEIVRLSVRKTEIQYEIYRLEGYTEICPRCNGSGKIMTIHRFMGNHSYMRCISCNGIGRVSQEELKIFKSNKEI